MYVFFFNDTATTEIYTYGHTLSLHDALPICRVDLPRHVRQVEVALGAQVVHDGSQRAHGAVRTARAGGDALPVAGVLHARLGADGPALAVLRSEEHTSELQSLMRISYAVFCLKKKTHIHNTIHQPLPQTIYTLTTNDVTY